MNEEIKNDSKPKACVSFLWTLVRVSILESEMDKKQC